MVPSRYGLVSMTFFTVCDAAEQEEKLAMMHTLKLTTCMMTLTYICAHAGSGVHSDDDATLKHEA